VRELAPQPACAIASASFSPAPFPPARAQLTAAFSPTSLDISNDSAAHRHHAPMRAAGGGNGESHFSVHVVSDKFEGVVSGHSPPSQLLPCLVATGPESPGGANGPSAVFLGYSVYSG